jgi:microcystin-dependent protein
LPLETATFTNDLVVANPAHTDSLSQADSHMRLIKATLKNTLPNWTSGALVSTQAQLDAATAAVVTNTATLGFRPGTAALPGLFPVGGNNTGFYCDGANRLGVTVNGTAVALFTTTALSTTLGFAAAAILSTGAYSGGTGQLVPIGATLIWWEDTLPAEGGYAWANGQIIASANTVCPILLARWGSRFGGNGTTTMGVPNLQEAVPVGKSGMGGASSPGRLASIASGLKTTLAGFFGIDTNTLITANFPPYTPAGSVGTGSSTIPFQDNAAGTINANSTGSSNVPSTHTSTVSVTAGAFTGTAQGGTSTPVNNVDPKTVCNYIIRLA